MVAFYSIFFSKYPKLWLLIIPLILIIISFTYPKIFRIPNKIWYKFGILLDTIIAPVTMVFVYLVTIIPIGLLFKILKRDLLNEKLNKNLINDYKNKYKLD